MSADIDDGQYAYRGLTFGRGTDYPLTLAQLDGLEGYSVNVGDRALPRGHGSVPGKHFAVARQVLAEFVVARISRDALEAAQRVLADSFLLDVDDQSDLEFKKPGEPQRLIRCRPTQFQRGDTRIGLQAAPKVVLTAADPRIYSAEEHTALVPLYTPSGGAIDYPVDYPINFPAGVTHDVVVVNEGNADAPVVIRFYGTPSGSLTAVTLANQSTGDAATVAASIADGQILTVDMGAYVTGNGELVVALDGASRYGSWSQPRMPLLLPPGESVLRFTATGSATTATAVVTWRDTWLS